MVLQDTRGKPVTFLFHQLPSVVGNDRHLHLAAGLRLQCRHPAVVDLALVADDQDVDVALLIEGPRRSAPVDRDRDAFGREVLDAGPDEEEGHAGPLQLPDGKGVVVEGEEPCGAEARDGDQPVALEGIGIRFDACRTDPDLPGEFIDVDLARGVGEEPGKDPEPDERLELPKHTIYCMIVQRIK